MKRKRIVLLMIITMITFMSMGCRNNDLNDNEGENKPSLRFNDDNCKEERMKVEGKDIKFRAYENIVYVEHPVDTKYEVMNIYIPEEYFNDEKTDNFTAETAPIFFPNNIGGYLPAEPGKPSMEGEITADASRQGMTSDKDSKKDSPNSILMALSEGYVVASAGARGRTLEDKERRNIGKAPADIVDLKAAVRYLHYNDDVMAGDAERMISNGTSAGGALSVLLGATGNNKDYEKYLKELGAADASDAVFAVSAYCPITSLEHADVCYEWMFNGINDYEKIEITNENGKIKRTKKAMTQTEEQKKFSDELKADFPQYINNLNLKDDDGVNLTVNNGGNGAFKNFVKSFIIKSAQKELNEGKDLSQESWLTIKDNIVGTKETDNQHFTKFSEEKDAAGGTLADSKIIKMMNPLNYIGNDGSDTAKYWRIRHGEKDSDTSLCIPVILSQRLKNTGYNVDFEVPWDQGHGGDYDLDELFEWVEEIVKQ